MGSAVRACFSKYATFSGRASRSEYWWFMLWTVLMQFLLGFIGAFVISFVMAATGSGGVEAEELGLLVGNGLAGVFNLAVFLPTLAVHARRLHDTGHSGWWFLLYFTLIGGIVVFIWLVSKGDDGDNQYGAASTGADAGAPLADAQGAAAGTGLNAADLMKLKALLDQGVLSQEEFDAEKRKMMGEAAPPSTAVPEVPSEPVAIAPSTSAQTPSSSGSPAKIVIGVIGVLLVVAGAGLAWASHEGYVFIPFADQEDIQKHFETQQRMLDALD